MKRFLRVALPCAAALLIAAFFLFRGRGVPDEGAQTAAAPLRVAVVSDIHYTGEADYRYTGSFAAANDASGSGKQVELLPQLLDAFAAQLLREKPDVLLITGDNAFNGARVSHEALIRKLAPLRKAGILVLTLPGNHDINTRAMIFPDGEAQNAISVTPEEFAALYADFGYDGALSRDADSLSYVYDTGAGTRIFMLDTNFRYGAVYGRVGEETLGWLSRELKACRDAGDRALVAGHHNMLVHNPLFAFNYTVDDGEALRQLLEANGVTLFLSGHLHPQSIVSEGGVSDIATECFAVYPHRYGLIELEGDIWRYTACETDVESWAAENGLQDERLTLYRQYGYDFLYEATARQLREQLAGLEDESAREELCGLLAQANVNYFIGEPSPAPEEAMQQLLTKTDLGFFAGYLSTITDLPSSLLAEGRFGTGEP